MNSAWTVDRDGRDWNPALLAHWRLRKPGCRADVLVWLDGRIEWTCGRIGELGTRWLTNDMLVDARLDAEAALEDMPVFGPLEPDAYAKPASCPADG